MSQTKFIHLRDHERSGRISSNGGATIAFRIHEGIVEYAFSECHWRDNFCKKLGRVKAEGKLNSERHRRIAQYNGMTMGDLEIVLTDDYYNYKSRWFPLVGEFRFRPRKNKGNLQRAVL